MIVTECPSCDAPQMIELSAYSGGWTPVRCEDCGSVMWVQATTIGGTTYDSDGFFKHVVRPGDEAEVREAEKACLRGDG